MEVLVIVNYFPIAKSIARYLLFKYNYSSTIITLKELNEKGIGPYISFKYVITETHDSNSVDYGIQFGKIFESHSGNTTFFFTQNYFLPGYTIKDLPTNSFYIPFQLKDFFNHFTKSEFVEKASTKLEQILFSNPLTSSHH